LSCLRSTTQLLRPRTNSIRTTGSWNRPDKWRIAEGAGASGCLG
jgi:hypothetical protein